MLNLINDAWIPVICENGTQRVIAPWQMAEQDILRPDWPRPDMNIACYEFLIGLVYLADPPRDEADWAARASGDADRLRERLAPYAPAFNLIGDGPLFLQDFSPISGDETAVDMLFIDSAGANAAKNNADLMVHRRRYRGLELPLAAMALYTLQNFAPSGGAGNRTSLRGGGPMVTLVDPEAGLWALVWANTPSGVPVDMRQLPWMRETRVSHEGQKTLPPEGKLFGVEAFFGMPRRLRLVVQEGLVSGVVQKPYGTNYAMWKHPLSPYYRMKVGEEWLPVHPRAGRFGYRNWLGVVAEDAQSETREKALCLRQRDNSGAVIVAGWAMDNMKPRDFIWSVLPFYNLEPRHEQILCGFVRAGEAAAVALRGALEPILAQGEAREAERETFFVATEDAFRGCVDAMIAGENAGDIWLRALTNQALGQFDALALAGLAQRETRVIREIVEARKYLVLALRGYGKQGRALFEALEMDVPVVKKKEKSS